MSDLAAAMMAMSAADRRAALEALPPADVMALAYHWPLFARSDQIPPPGTWRTWALLGGRGSGKTRTAAETVRARVEAGRARHIGIIGPTAETLRRDVVQGPSGLLAVCPPWNMPSHEPSQRRLVWPNGAVAYLLSSEEPNRIRGPNLDFFWGDELTSWTTPEDCWSNLQFALRITGPKGDSPAGIISTTPKRHKLLKAILSDPATVVTRSTTFDNAANLDTETLAYLRRRYEGSTIGRQELMAELLDDAEGALWSRVQLDEGRVFVAPDMKRIVVAVDPAGSSNAKSDETGIIACGLGVDGRGYVLADASGKYSPDGWARAAVNLYHSLKADRIVAEKNYGGEMCEATIRAVDRNVPVKMVHATRGKAVRAEPVAALYEQRRVSHIGNLPGLEDQMCGWAPGDSDSPDRMDALVWAFTELMVDEQHGPARCYQLGPYLMSGQRIPIRQRAVDHNGIPYV